MRVFRDWLRALFMTVERLVIGSRSDLHRRWSGVGRPGHCLCTVLSLGASPVTVLALILTFLTMSAGGRVPDVSFGSL